MRIFGRDEYVSVSNDCPSRQKTIVDIGRARFDVAARRLTLGGAAIALDHRPTELLILLLGRIGQTVPKNEILDRLWPDRAVTEASLTKCVRQLRLALGDDDHALVRTVHGQGFRIEASYPVEAPPPQPAQRRAPRIWLAAPVLALCAAVAAWRIFPAGHGAHVPPAAARALYIKGMQDWAQRTPATLSAAVDDFTGAVRIDPAYAEAYVGLANTYNLLREYAGMSDTQAFALARTASEQALRLNPELAGAHAAHAFVLFWGDWDFSAAIAEYERALRLEPDNPNTHHCLATSLDNVGQHTQALASIDRALELSPDSRSIRADRALILFHMGHTDEARAALTTLASTDPDFPSPHRYLADIALANNDDASFLREGARFAQATHRPVAATIIAAAAAGQKTGGHPGMIQSLLTARLAAFETGSIDEADIASAYALAGNHPAALRTLTQAIDRHELAATYILNDPGLRLLVADPAGAPLLARLRLSPESARRAEGAI
jgi:DNA-binding winged helix-turn-helix (wHTH) protein/tetratricopeptide (TPR) repeat protein